MCVWTWHFIIYFLPSLSSFPYASPFSSISTTLEQEPSSPSSSPFSTPPLYVVLKCVSNWSLSQQHNDPLSMFTYVWKGFSLLQLSLLMWWLKNILTSLFYHVIVVVSSCKSTKKQLIQKELVVYNLWRAWKLKRFFSKTEIGYIAMLWRNRHSAQLLHHSWARSVNNTG